MNGLDPADDSDLLRMVWAPKCYDDNIPTGACFDADDLFPKTDRDGQERFVSADSEVEISKNAVDARILVQQRDGNRERLGRQDARFIRLNCGELRSLPDNGGGLDCPLTIERDRVEGDPKNGIPENPAHCAVRNRSQKSRTDSKAANRLYVEYLRKELLKRIKDDLSYQQVFPQAAR